MNDRDEQKVIGNLGLTNRDAAVRMEPDENSPIVFRTRTTHLLVVNVCDDPYWLCVLGTNGEHAYVRAMDVQDLGYPVRRKAPVLSEL